jgi:hypothetical protein
MAAENKNQIQSPVEKVEKDEKQVDLKEKVKIVGKKGAKFLTAGEVKEVHPVLAARLVKKGEAEYKK